MDRFSEQQIEELREEFAKFHTMDSEGLKELNALLDVTNNAALLQLVIARIPFVSKIAENRAKERGLL